MMPKRQSVLAILIGAFFFFPASPAHALEVSLASILQGEVRVLGRGAANAAIFWQGVQVTTATRGGTFNFKTEDVPATCVGELTDGVETLFIAVNGCIASEIISPEITAAVPVTGQTASFAADDDGAIQAGVPFPDPRFTDNGDGTVTDKLTGLMWLQDADCPSQRTWANALADVAELNELGRMNGNACANYTAVYDDWRLPNVRELQSLVHFGFFDPALSNAAGDEKWTTKGDAFISVRVNFYWSSTTFAFFTSHALGVDFFNGFVVSGTKGATLNRRVVAVRGGLLPE